MKDLKLIDAEEKLERIEDYLRRIYRDMEKTSKCLMEPESMHKGFFCLGSMATELYSILEIEFPEKEDNGNC